MAKNKSASAQKAKTTKAVKPAKSKAEPKEIIIVHKDFELGQGSKKRTYKEGQEFQIPHGWVRNLHQEGVMNPKAVAMCFDEVVEEKENEDTGEMEVVRICTHAMPLKLKAQK